MANPRQATKRTGGVTNWGRGMLFISLLCSVALLYVLFDRFDMDGWSDSYKDIGWQWLILSLICLWLHFLATTMRYAVVLDPENPRFELRLPALLRLTFFTLFLAVTLPASGLADLVRVGILWKRFGIAGRRALESVLHDRLIGMTSMLLSVLLLVPLVTGVNSVYRDLALQMAVVLLGGVVLARMLLPLLFKWLGNRWFIDVLGNFFMLIAGGRRFGFHFLIMVVSVITLALSFWFSALAMGLVLPVWVVVFMAPLLLIVQSIPVFYAGWGSREALVVSLIGGASATNEQAFALSVLFGVVLTVSALPGAAVYLLDREGYDHLELT